MADQQSPLPTPPPPPPAQQSQPTKKAPSTLPSPFNLSSASSSSTNMPSTTPMTLISQGAEAHLYRTVFLTPTLPCALKIRPRKPWRHATLDRRLTRARLLAEARVLAKCRREGVPVPAVYAVDWEAGWMACEWIEGVGSVKEGIGRWEEDVARRGRGTEGSGDDGAEEEELKGLLERMGRTVGVLHRAGVIHGDLTTSNMMLRSPPSSTSSSSSTTTNDPSPPPELPSSSPSPLAGPIILIDFGLATQSVSDEDRAVDLYVLERAFGSTHPRREHLFAATVLAAYAGSYPGAKGALRKLEEVRMRGRKKSMLG